MQLIGCVYARKMSEIARLPHTNDHGLDNAHDEGARGDASTATPEAVVRVDIQAAPDDVWDALTTDDGLASWIGEGSSIGDQVGGDIDVHDVVTGQRRRGVLDELSPGQRLGYTWWPETEPARATRVAISIEPTRTGTRVTVVESRPLVTNAPAMADGSSAARAMAMSYGDWTWRTALLGVASQRSAPLRGLARTF